MSVSLGTAARPDASFAGVARLLTGVLPELDVSADALRAPSLETLARQVEPARVISAEVIEGESLRAHVVESAPTVGFAAFLDGTQASRALHYMEDGAPIVHGTAAAVIRVRRDRR